MMGIIIWLIVGGIIGWIASMIMKTDGQQGIFLNIVVGIIGAFLGGWIGGMLGIGGDINSGDFSLSGLERWTNIVLLSAPPVTESVRPVTSS